MNEEKLAARRADKASQAKRERAARKVAVVSVVFLEQAAGQQKGSFECAELTEAQAKAVGAFVRGILERVRS